MFEIEKTLYPRIQLKTLITELSLSIIGYLL